MRQCSHKPTHGVPDTVVLSLLLFFCILPYYNVHAYGWLSKHDRVLSRVLWFMHHFCRVLLNKGRACPMTHMLWLSHGYQSRSPRKVQHQVEFLWSTSLLLWPVLVGAYNTRL